MPTRSEKVTFTGAQGDVLAARLELPAGEPRAYALFAHCFTCSKDVFAATRIAKGLAEGGIAVLRFDFTGLGSSGGDFANTNFCSNVGDLVAAATFLREHHAAPAILIGHSLGGAAVLAAAHSVPEAKAVVTIGAPCDPAHVAHVLGDAKETIERQGEAEVTIAGRSFRIKKQFLDDIAAVPMREAIGKLRKALLIFHAPLDDTVSIDNAGLIFQSAKHPKSFISLDGADHLLTRKADAEYVASAITGWVSRYLPAHGGAQPAQPAQATAVASTAPTPAAAPIPDDGWMRVSETGRGAYANEIRLGKHTLLADEPEKYGGTDTGMSPYDFLMAGLGSCTAMTIRMYAERKQWPLERVSVKLHHEKIHAEDCAECETKVGKIDRFERVITVTGRLDDAQRQSLLAIADKCPVHRTLHAETNILTRLEP